MVRVSVCSSEHACGRKNTIPAIHNRNEKPTCARLVMHACGKSAVSTLPRNLINHLTSVVCLHPTYAGFGFEHFQINKEHLSSCYVSALHNAE